MGAHFYRKDFTIKRQKIIVAGLAAVGILVLLFGGSFVYVAYAKNNCNKVSSKRSSYIQYGEPYIQLEDKQGKPLEYVKRDVFIDLCLAEKFNI